MRENSAIVMPIMVPALLGIAEKHWNKQIAVFIRNVLSFFRDMNAQLFDDLLVSHQDTVIK